MSHTFPNLEDWFRDPDAVRLWNETWKQPHMLLGLQVLASAGRPAAQPFSPGVDLIQATAIQGARCEGYFHALRAVDLMRQTPVRAVDLKQPTGWGADRLSDPLAEPTLEPEPA